MAPFYGWGSTASWLEPLRGGIKSRSIVSHHNEILPNQYKKTSSKH